MIVTFDTSILVRATKRSNGPARRAVDAMASDADHVIALSPFILGEVGKVLSYPRMLALYRLTPDEIHEHIEFLRSVSRIVEPEIGLPVVLSDPKDAPVIYTAVAAGADILSVKDRDFYDPSVIAFCQTEDIRVMDDVTLLELFR
jgi:putative PIN family toxin of toxin-antitoxin system